MINMNCSSFIDDFYFARLWKNGTRRVFGCTCALYVLLHSSAPSHLRGTSWHHDGTRMHRWQEVSGQSIFCFDTRGKGPGTSSGSSAPILTRGDALNSSPQVELHEVQDLPPGILLGSSVRGRTAPPQSDHCK